MRRIGNRGENYRRKWSPTVEGCTIGQLDDGSPVPLSQFRTPPYFAGESTVDLTGITHFYSAEVCSFPHRDGEEEGKGHRRRLTEHDRTRVCNGKSRIMNAGASDDELFGRGVYAGEPMQCARIYCPAEAVSLLRNELCVGCAGKDAAARFPRTVSVGSVVENTSAVVSVGCPPGFVGALNRSCSDAGWSRTVGSCTRVRCDRLDIPLTGSARDMAYRDEDGVVHSHEEMMRHCYELRNTLQLFTFDEDNIDVPLLTVKGWIGGWITGPCKDLLAHTLTFDATNPGPERMVVECRSPSYSGQMSARCDASTNTWVDIQGSCEYQICPAESRTVTLDNGVTVRTRFPPQEYRTDPGAPPTSVAQLMIRDGIRSPWDVVPCCSSFSFTGSCIGDEASFGWMVSRCDAQGNRVMYQNPDDEQDWARRSPWYAKQIFRCQPLSTVHGPRLDQSVADAEQLWKGFRLNTGDMSDLTKRRWTLPETGIFASVSMQMDLSSLGGKAGKWYPVFSTRTDDIAENHNPNPVTIDTRPEGEVSAFQDPDEYSHYQRGKGRAAAAFAQVACRQLGYRRAAVVTNCRALNNNHLTKKPHPDPWWDAHGKSLRELACPEVHAGDKRTKTCPSSHLVLLSQGDTLRQGMAVWLNHHVQFPWINESVYDMTQWRDWDGPMPTFSSCMGSETEVARCFQSQVQQARRSYGQPERTRPCLSKVLLGCTNENSRPAREGSPPYTAEEEGVWVIGDSKSDDVLSDEMYWSPKIFTDVGGPWNCTSGEPLTPEEIATATDATACWGKLLDKTDWMPKTSKPESEWCICSDPHCIGTCKDADDDDSQGR